MKNNWYLSCIFCRIARSEPERLPEYDRPIIETSEFFVVPALGQFTEGYVLICPRAHVTNFGIIDSGLFSQFMEVKEQVRTLLFEEFHQKPVFFEHGSVSSSRRVGTCIDHAHLHAVPVDLVAAPSGLSEHLRDGRIRDLGALVEYAKAGNPYFYFESSNGQMYLYDALLLPCQYGRRVIAREVGADERWDWRRYPYYDEAIETARRLRTRTSRNSNRGSVIDAHYSRILCATDRFRALDHNQGKC